MIRLWLEEIWQDLRYAGRIFAKAPGFTIVAVLTLALGIGANTAIFSIVESVLLRPLPYHDPARLVVIWDSIRGDQVTKIFVDYRDFDHWRKHAQSFESIAALTWANWAGTGRVLTARGPAKRLLAIPVSSSFFEMLGVKAARGRVFTDEDEKHGCSVVLSDQFWRSELASDPAIVGQKLVLNQSACTVLGVMPERFVFYPREAQLWILLGPDFRPARETIHAGIFARLAPGVTREQAQAEVVSLHNALFKDDKTQRDFTPVVYDLQSEFTWLAGRTLRTTLLALTGAVGFVLLIVCLNVANLLLGRSLIRQRELAVRVALGAGRRRLVRQLLTEGFLLSLVGSVLGVAFAFGAIRYFRFLGPIELPPGADVAVHLPALVFTGALAVAATLVFGLLPARRASQIDVSRGVKAAGRGAVQGWSRGWLVKGLLLAETALSVVLLAGAWLLMESVLRMSSEPLGYDPTNIVTADVALPTERYSEAACKIRFYEDLEQRIGGMAGVADVGLNSTVFYNTMLDIQGRPSSPDGRPRDVGAQAVTPGYFRALKIPLLTGRLFSARDQSQSEAVALVNEALARKFFSDRNPIGQRIRFGEPGHESPWLTIVGVTGNVKGSSPFYEGWKESLTIFRPLSQSPGNLAVINVRTVGPQALGEAMQRELASIDPEIPAGRMRTMEAQLAETLAYPRFRALVFGAFAICALMLAAVGLHGVLGQFVAQRTQEFGVRMAVGAQARDIFALVARQGGLPVVGGLVAGVGGAIILTRAVASLFYGVRPGEPLTLAGVVLTLVAVAAVAISLPARRAARVDPMVALRDE